MSGRDKDMKHFFIRLIIALAAAFGTASPTHAEVRIGLSVPRTGTYGWIGTYAEEGVRIALADLNAKGGALGEPIVTITVDDTVQPTRPSPRRESSSRPASWRCLVTRARPPLSQRQGSMPRPAS
jgi:hypothetical protein